MSKPVKGLTSRLYKKKDTLWLKRADLRNARQQAYTLETEIRKLESEISVIEAELESRHEHNLAKWKQATEPRKGAQ